MHLAGSNRRAATACDLSGAAVETVAVYRGDRIVSAATLFPEGPHVRELCLLFAPEAGQAMLPLVRIAQLMIRPLVDHGTVIVARIKPSNRAASDGPPCRLPRDGRGRRSALDLEGLMGSIFGGGCQNDAQKAADQARADNERVAPDPAGRQRPAAGAADGRPRPIRGPAGARRAAGDCS